eukprot:3690079-Amphidinium_carterae.2
MSMYSLFLNPKSTLRPLARPEHRVARSKAVSRRPRNGFEKSQHKPKWFKRFVVDSLDHHNRTSFAADAFSRLL